jgi:hypothetical protein
MARHTNLSTSQTAMEICSGYHCDCYFCKVNERGDNRKTAVNLSSIPQSLIPNFVDGPNGIIMKYIGRRRMISMNRHLGHAYLAAKKFQWPEQELNRRRLRWHRNDPTDGKSKLAKNSFCKLFFANIL